MVSAYAVGIIIYYNIIIYINSIYYILYDI